MGQAACMSRRRSIEIEGLRHQSAIPVASRIGPMIMSSPVLGFDPGTRDLPEPVAAQVANIFGHVEAMLRAEAADWGDVLRMTFVVRDHDTRDVIEELWLERMPDPGSRAARQVQLDETARIPVTAEFTAYVERPD